MVIGYLDQEHYRIDFYWGFHFLVTNFSNIFTVTETTFVANSIVKQRTIHLPHKHIVFSSLILYEIRLMISESICIQHLFLYCSTYNFTFVPLRYIILRDIHFNYHWIYQWWINPTISTNIRVKCYSSSTPSYHIKFHWSNLQSHFENMSIR